MWLIAICGGWILLFPGIAVSAEGNAVPGCAPPQLTASAELPSGARRATLRLVSGESTSIGTLWHSGAQQFTIDLQVSHALHPNDTFLRVDPTALRGDGLHSVVGAQYLQAEAHVTRQDVQLNICVNAHGLAPGPYKTTLEFDDPRIRPFTLLIAVDRSYDGWWLVTIVFLLTVTGAAYYTFALTRKIHSGTEIFAKGWLRQFGRWLSQWGGIASVVAGLLAALAVFNAQYWQSDFFGHRLIPDWIGFVTAVAAGFVSASTVPQVFSDKPRQAAVAPSHQRRSPSRRRSKPEQQPVPAPGSPPTSEGRHHPVTQ